MTLPQDIRPEWFNVIRRLQSVAHEGNQGLAVLEISVLVDEKGDPIVWTEPKRTKLEPWRLANLVLRLLTAGQGQT
jgi:hypothetical protein